MFAIQFVSQELFPLKKSDAASNALIFMDDWQVKELPVVELGQLLGYVNYATLLDQPTLRVEQLMRDPKPFSVASQWHIFDVWNHFAHTGFDTLALINAEGYYEGMILAKDLAKEAFNHSALVQEGAILVLQMEAIQYSLAEISRICEANEAKIIHMMVEPLKDDRNTLLVSLKLNKSFPSYVMASLERFGYQIVFSSATQDPNHSLEDRYKWLVKYLNT